MPRQPKERALCTASFPYVNLTGHLEGYRGPFVIHSYIYIYTHILYMYMYIYKPQPCSCAELLALGNASGARHSLMCQLPLILLRTANVWPAIVREGIPRKHSQKLG